MHVDVLAVTHGVECQVGVAACIDEQARDRGTGHCQVVPPEKRSIGGVPDERERDRIAPGGDVVTDGHEITVKYKGGEKKIVLLPQTRIVTFVPGDRSELRPGVKIFIAAARKKDDGTLEADSIAAGRDGLPPPM